MKKMQEEWVNGWKVVTERESEREWNKKKRERVK